MDLYARLSLRILAPLVSAMGLPLCILVQSTSPRIWEQRDTVARRRALLTVLTAYLPSMGDDSMHTYDYLGEGNLVGGWIRLADGSIVRATTVCDGYSVTKGWDIRLA